MAAIDCASRTAPRKRGESRINWAASALPSGDEKTAHTLRARCRPASRRGAGSQLRSGSCASGFSSSSVCDRTASRAATTCSQMPLPPHEQTARSARGPVPPAHSTATVRSPRGSRTMASTLKSSTARSATRPPSTRASAVRTRSRANQDPMAAGRRDRQVAKGVSLRSAPAAARQADRATESFGSAAVPDCPDRLPRESYRPERTCP